MKTYIALSALLFSFATANAQNTEKVDYQYKNNNFSAAEVEKQITTNSPGKMLYNRLQAFDSFSKATRMPFVSREQFYKYLEEFKGLSGKAKMYGYNNYVEKVQVFYTNIKNLSRLSNKDDWRGALYDISYPVYKVIDENWGDDIVEAVIDEAYLNLYEYTNKKASGDPHYASAPAWVNMDPIKTNESAGQCQYTVKIDKPVLKKDDIEVYFCDLPLFRKISKKYSGQLLNGPILGWQGTEKESEQVRNMLRAYEGNRKMPAYYVYVYNLKDYGNPSTIQQNLYKGEKWFVWVFRDGKLYYSYMAIPCSEMNLCTVYEEREIPGVTDVNDISYE